VPLIDAHVHFFPASQRERRGTIAGEDRGFAAIYADPRAKMATASDLVAALDEAGLGAAVAAGFAFSGARELEEQNAALIAAATEFPQRVIPLAAVNPALPGWLTAAEAALDAGARGFGELRPGGQGWDPLGPAGRQLCELARARAVVLLWHVSEPLGHGYPGKEGGISPVDLGRLAFEHPGLAMIAAHLGGGLSFYLQMPEVKTAFASLYFDTAASSLLYDERSVARLVDLAGEQHVLFASDYPLLSPKRQLERVTALVGAEAAAAVCGGNAQRLFSDIQRP
jgi:predicted TIM-barrel fold metal-dependent hydrolase